MGIGIRFDGFDTVNETIEICRRTKKALEEIGQRADGSPEKPKKRK